MAEICNDCGNDVSTHEQQFKEHATDYAVLKSFLTMFQGKPDAVTLTTSIERITHDWQVHALPQCSPLSKA